MMPKHTGKLVAIFFIVGFSIWPTMALAAGKKYFSLGTGNPGGTNYFIGAGFAGIFNKYVPEVRVIAESTSASEEKFRLVLRKKMDMGFAALLVIEPALKKN